MTFSYAAAIESTLVQLSAISVPPLSAAYPPKDGMTSPPRERMVEMSAPNTDDEIGWLVEPFQYGVHEPFAVGLDERHRQVLGARLLRQIGRAVGGVRLEVRREDVRGERGRGVRGAPGPDDEAGGSGDGAERGEQGADGSRTSHRGLSDGGERRVRTPHDWSGPTPGQGSRPIHSALFAVDPQPTCGRWRVRDASATDSDPGQRLRQVGRRTAHSRRRRPRPGGPAATMRPPSSPPPGPRSSIQSAPATTRHVVLDDDHRVARVDQAVQLAQQDLDVGRVQSRRRLVQDVQGVVAADALQLRGQLDALGLAARQLGGGLAQAQIAEADVEQRAPDCGRPTGCPRRPRPPPPPSGRAPRRWCGPDG